MDIRWQRLPANEHDASLEYGADHYDPSALSNAIAEAVDQLRALGASRSWRVVLNCGLDDRYVISLLALMTMGCCAIPIDSSTPDRVVRDIITRTGARLVIGDENTALVPADGRDRIGDPSFSRTGGVTDEAYILFTSGSSGTAKGVIGSFEGLADRLQWGCVEFHSPDVKRCAVKTNPTFVDSLTEILSAYFSGRELVIAPLSARLDVSQLCAFVRQAGIQQMTLTPSVIPVLDAVAGNRLRTIRRWVFSGEALSRSRVEKVRALTPHAEIVNSYGSTEVSGDCTFFRLRSTDRVPVEIPVGSPPASVQVRLETAEPGLLIGDETDDCDVGELWVGGNQVARGYLVPDEPDGRFTLDSKGTRWFRTGDLMRELDGIFYYLGRADDMRKVRGRRVSLGGVVAALESLDDVREAFAWVSETESGVGALSGAVVLDSGSPVSTRSLRSDLAARMLPHMVPDQIHVVDELPRNAHGKIDVSKLAEFSRSSGEIDSTQFETGTEWLIASVVEETAGWQGLLPLTPFEDLGVDSLTWVVISEQLGRFLGAGLTTLDVISAGNIRRLGQQVPLLRERLQAPAVRIVREGDGNGTLVLVHPAIGTCLGYFRLIRQLKYRGRIAFVEQDQTARKILADDGMEALAAYYSDMLTEIVGKERIVVAGFSFGALLVPEMSRELSKRGTSVWASVLIDPAWVRPDSGRHDWAIRRILVDGGYGTNLPSEPIDIDDALNLIAADEGPLAQTPESQVRHWEGCLRVNVESCQGYRPKGPQTEVLVVRATKTSTVVGVEEIRMNRAHWDAEEVELDVTHFELLYGSAVTQLAEALDSFLERMEQR